MSFSPINTNQQMLAVTAQTTRFMPLRASPKGKATRRNGWLFCLHAPKRLNRVDEKQDGTRITTRPWEVAASGS
jgi:hypothetical protein